MTVPHFINRYGWVWTIVSGVFVAGMLWSGVKSTEAQSTANNDSIQILQTDMAAVKAQVQDIHDYLIGGRR